MDFSSQMITVSTTKECNAEIYHLRWVIRLRSLVCQWNICFIFLLCLFVPDLMHELYTNTKMLHQPIRQFNTTNRFL